MSNFPDATPILYALFGLVISMVPFALYGIFQTLMWILHHVHFGVN